MENTKTDNTPNIIEFKGVDIVNGSNLVLQNVSFSIQEGEFVYLLGKVGSGKTSIIHSLIGEIPIRKGEASICGFNLRKLKKRQIPYLRRNIGVVFQDFQLLMDRSVEDNLLFVLEATGWKRRKEMLARVEEVLQMVGLPHKASKMPHQLSGGEQQRVAIARALINKPAVLFADEPSGNLDTKTKEEIHKLFFDLRDKYGQTVVIVTHDPDLAKMCDRSLYMVDGVFV